MRQDSTARQVVAWTACMLVDLWPRPRNLTPTNRILHSMPSSPPITTPQSPSTPSPCLWELELLPPLELAKPLTPNPSPLTPHPISAGPGDESTEDEDEGFRGKSGMVVGSAGDSTKAVSVVGGGRAKDTENKMGFVGSR